MYNLPDKCKTHIQYGKDYLAKQTQMSAALKRTLEEQVKDIYLEYSLQADSINIPSGNDIDGILVFVFTLKQNNIDERILQHLDRSIPYPLLFIIKYAGQVRAVICFKQKDGSNKAFFSVKQYYYTPWQSDTELNFNISGINLGIVYENLVRQIGNLPSDSKPIETNVEQDTKRRKIEAQIAKLEQQIHAEKQFNRQCELSDKLKALKKTLNEI